MTFKVDNYEENQVFVSLAHVTELIFCFWPEFRFRDQKYASDQIFKEIEPFLEK